MNDLTVTDEQWAAAGEALRTLDRYRISDRDFLAALTAVGNAIAAAYKLGHEHGLDS